MYPFKLSVGRIHGYSMLPRVTPDSFIIAIKLPRWYPKRVGQLFYLQHPRYGRIIKTLSVIDGRRYWFRGESNDSVSSEAIGIMTETNIIGNVIFVISPKNNNI